MLHIIGISSDTKVSEERVYQHINRGADGRLWASPRAYYDGFRLTGDSQPNEAVGYLVELMPDEKLLGLSHIKII